MRAGGPRTQGFVRASSVRARAADPGFGYHRRMAPARVFLVHGWSVQETTTYRGLHKALAAHGFDLRTIHLSRYVSLESDIEIRDIARAMHRALEEQLGPAWDEPFHIVTHSTGALVARHWIARHYTGRFASKKPLRNIVFLAPPHFGSRLAHHGRSMLAQVAWRGETGRIVLTALELGSSFCWDLTDAWLDPATWRDKGIRPYCLTGDRVVKKLFASRIFPAAYEPGSDMVVRAPAANLNVARFTLTSGGGPKLERRGGIEGVPFAALDEYTHSGPGHGIMNSVTADATPERHRALRLILECLGVRTEAGYAAAGALLDKETRRTRRKRPAYAQLDLRIRDEDGRPVEDFVFKLGAVVKGRRLPSKTVAHIHRNKESANHLTAYLTMKQLEPQYTYFIEIDTAPPSDLFRYTPDPFIVEAPERRITEVIREDRTTQVDIVLSREPGRNLFVLHRGDDPDLHVRWDRRGSVTKKRLPDA